MCDMKGINEQSSDVTSLYRADRKKRARERNIQKRARPRPNERSQGHKKKLEERKEMEKI